MKIRTSILTAMFLFIGFSTHISIANAEDKKEKNAPVQITLYPSFAPKPALKYKLLPDRINQIQGNAAVYYGKVRAEESVFFYRSKEMWHNIYGRWQEAPLRELVKEKARISTGRSIEFCLDRAARCRYCDWQMPIGDVPFYHTLLPQLQQIRQLSNMMSAKARIAIAHKRYDEAMHLFQMNHAMARHVNESEFVVGSLIGMAICGVMDKQVLEFIQQPDTPNLYWALTALPTPMIDFRKSAELETHGFALTYPELVNREGVTWPKMYGGRRSPELWKTPPFQRTPDEWRKLFHAVMKEGFSMISNNDKGKKKLKSEKELDQECKLLFGKAKEILIKNGLRLQQVEKMTIHEAALHYIAYRYQVECEEVVAFFNLPYPTAKRMMDQSYKRFEKESKDVDIERVIRCMLPGLFVAKAVQTRLDREIAVLRVLEALRIHAAHNKGTLPEKLEDITKVPVPNDPVTQKAFGYKLENGKAHLSTTKVPYPAYSADPSYFINAKHYEITMKKLPK